MKNDTDITKKINVEFEVITYEGKHKFEIVELLIPNFKDRIVKLTVDENRMYTVEEQIDEYLSDLDKTQLMHDNEWHLIINWSLESQTEKVKQFLSDRYETNSQFRVDVIATYAKMYKAIKDLSFEKQVQIIFYAMDLGLDAASTAYKSISDILKSNSVTKKLTTQPTNSEILKTFKCQN